jgi:hypothetical protein
MRLHTPLFEGNAGDASNGGGTLLGGAISTTQATQTTAQATSTTAVDDSGSAPRFDFRSALDDTGAFKPGWEANLPADLKDSAPALAKYPTLEQAMRGLANAQKLIGAKQNALKAPAPDAPPAEHEKYQAAMREALHIPADVKDYKIEIPTDLPEGIKLDEAKMGEFTALAHKLNIRPEAAKELVAFQAKEMAAMSLAGKAQLESYVKAQGDDLRTTWGDKMADNIATAKAAAEKLGLDVNLPELGNSAAFIKAMHEASKLMKSDTLIAGDAPLSGADGKAKADDILRNPTNPLHKAYHGKEGPARQKEVQDTYLRLMGVKTAK